MITEERREYNRNWYHANKDRVLARKVALATARKAEHRRRVRDYKQDFGCADCGESNPIVLDLDHDDPSEKIDDVSKLVGSGYSWDRIETEMLKCTVRCANCHRLRTAKQRDWDDS